MAFKDSINRFPRAMGRYTLMATRSLIRILPYPVFRFLSIILNVLARPILIKKRRLMIENLRMAFGKEKTEEEIRKIAGDCFDNFGRGMIDTIYFADRPEEIRGRVKFVGKENLDAALQKGKGVVLVSAHFGNFILMYLRMVVEGYPTNVIMKRTRDAAFERYISEFRDKQGVKTIYDLPARQCVQQCLKALRNNEILFILLDQNYGGDGRIFVDFFGQKAATAAGPVVFSNRTESPILPIFISSDDGPLKHKITIDPPFELVKGTDDAATIERNVANLTKVIEGKIRLSPYEWGGWMHKRWKSRPWEEQVEIDRAKSLGSAQT